MKLILHYILYNIKIIPCFREKDDVNEKNFKVTQNAQRPGSTEQPTPPPLIPSTPTPPPLQPPPLVPATTVSNQKATIQSQKVSTASPKTQPGILKKAASSTSISTAASSQSKILPSSPGSKLILVQKPKDQQTYSNQRQKVLNFTILQNFDKNNTKKEDGTKQMTILNKALTQSKNDNEDSNDANVKLEPKETNNLQYLMVKDEPLDWTDAEMEIIDSKEEEIFEEMTVKSEENAEEHSDDSNESGEVLEFSPLTCELCTETFTVPADWVRHVQTHTDMLPAKRRRRDSTGVSIFVNYNVAN